MKTQVTLLGLALVTALGVSAVANAQDAKLDPQAKVDAATAAGEAVDSAHAAEADAKTAREAAAAAKVTARTARTAQGAVIATDAAAIANQSALDARTASQAAGNAANDALGAKSAADFGNQPVGAVDEARQAAMKAELAGAVTADSADTAAAAAEYAATAPAARPTNPQATATSQAAQDVTVVSKEPDSIKGYYHIDFKAMDSNHDDFISKKEAASNPTLTAEFKAVDANHDGKLSQHELEGWMKKKS